jgi:hypothetical protein
VHSKPSRHADQDGADTAAASAEAVEVADTADIEGVNTADEGGGAWTAAKGPMRTAAPTAAVNLLALSWTMATP